MSIAKKKKSFHGLGFGGAGLGFGGAGSASPRQPSEKASAAPAALGFSCGFGSSYVSLCGFGGFDGTGSASQQQQQMQQQQQQMQQQQQQMQMLCQQQMQMAARQEQMAIRQEMRQLRVSQAKKVEQQMQISKVAAMIWAEKCGEEMQRIRGGRLGRLKRGGGSRGPRPCGAV